MVLIQVEEGKRQIWSSLALSAVGGLISSTIFILIAIPIFYFYGDRIRGWIAGKAKGLIYLVKMGPGPVFYMCLIYLMQMFICLM